MGGRAPTNGGLCYGGERLLPVVNSCAVADLSLSPTALLFYERMPELDSPATTPGCYSRGDYCCFRYRRGARCDGGGYYRCLCDRCADDTDSSNT